MTKNRLVLENVPGTVAHRVIDANLNRSREALRVCEDITRFVLNDRALTKSLKDIRHRIGRVFTKSAVIESRNVRTDIGRKFSFDKAAPNNFKTLFYNNIHRAQEAIRSLEEFSKLIAKDLSSQFKVLRFKVYSIEKKAIRKLFALRSN
jgi:thiamine-phosphate pyrophosphorylase